MSTRVCVCVWAVVYFSHRSVAFASVIALTVARRKASLFAPLPLPLSTRMLCLTPAMLTFYYILCALVCVSARTRVCLSVCTHCCWCCCCLSVAKRSGAHKQMIFNLLYLYVARISHCFCTFPHPKYFRTLECKRACPLTLFLASCSLCCCASDKAGAGAGAEGDCRRSWLSLRAQSVLI